MVRWLKQRWKRILAVCRIFVCACLQSYPPDRTGSTRPEAEVGAQRWSENKPCFLRLMCRLRLRCVLTPMWSLPGRELKNESHVSHGQVGLKPKKWFQLPTSPHFHQHWTGCALWQALCQGSDSPQRPPASGFCRTSRKALPGTEAGVLQNAKLEHQYNRHYKQAHQSCPAKGRQKKSVPVWGWSAPTSSSRIIETIERLRQCQRWKSKPKVTFLVFVILSR